MSHEAEACCELSVALSRYAESFYFCMQNHCSRRVSDRLCTSALHAQCITLGLRLFKTCALSSRCNHIRDGKLPPARHPLSICSDFQQFQPTDSCPSPDTRMHTNSALSESMSQSFPLDENPNMQVTMIGEGISGQIHLVPALENP